MYLPGGMGAVRSERSRLCRGAAASGDGDVGRVLAVYRRGDAPIGVTGICSPVPRILLSENDSGIGQRGPTGRGSGGILRSARGRAAYPRPGIFKVTS